MARSVVSLLDAAAYLLDLPEDDPDLLALEAMGCFDGSVFDPGPEGANIIRGWQLADELVGRFPRTAGRARPGRPRQPRPARGQRPRQARALVTAPFPAGRR